MKDPGNTLRRFVPCVSCVVLFWLVMSAYGAVARQSSRPAEQLEQAKGYHNKRDYSKAAAIYKDIIEQYPGTAHALQARKELTVLLIDSKEYAEAEAAFVDLTKGFARDPNLPKAIYEIGRKYGAVRRRAAAQGLYEYLIKAYPDDVYALGAKGRMVVLRIEFADADGAQRAMDELIADSRVHPDVERLFSEIAGHRPATYRTRRTEHYEQLDGGPRVYTGSSSGPARNRAEERLLYEYVHEHHPGTVYALHALKNLASHHISDIKHHPERIVVSKAGSRFVYLLNDERLEQATACIDKLFEDFSGHGDFPRAVFDLAERYRWSLDERPEFAEKLYRYLIDKHKDTQYPIRAQQSLVTFYIRTDRQGEAAEALDKLTEGFAGDPNLPRLVYHVGLCWEGQERKKCERAGRVYRYLARQYPNDSYGVLARARLLRLDIKRGQDDGLLVGIEQLMRDFGKHPALPKALFDVARGYSFSSDYTREIELLEFLCEQFPDSSVTCDAVYQIGYCYRLLEDYDTAAQYYKEVLREYPNSSYARHLPESIGNLYRSAGQYDKALYWYDRQSELPYYELGADRALHAKSVIYRHHLKDYDKAIEVLREYQQKFPDGAYADVMPYSLGQCCREKGNKEKVIKVLEEGLEACQNPAIAEKYREKLDELRSREN